MYGTGETAVIALDDVTLALRAGSSPRSWARPVRKSTLMHCLAGLDTLTAGQVFIGDVELGALSDRQLTLLRRDRIGFVFQAFNLVPTLSARDNITLPMTLAGTTPDRDWLAAVIERSVSPAGCAPPGRTLRRPAAAGRGGPGAGHPAADRLRRRADRQPRLP